MQILSPMKGNLKKLSVFVPNLHIAAVQNALFAIGCGHLGNYAECSFLSEGTGTYKGNAPANPYAGEKGKRHIEPETKLETVFQAHMQQQVIKALIKNHPYEEVAYDIVALNNDLQTVGSGLIGYLPEPMEEAFFLQMLKQSFDLQVIKHTKLLGKRIQKVAVCGGAGSFLLGKASQAGADIYITGDMKYHEFFDANDQLIVADIGHWESEQFTIELLMEVLQQNFPTFAVLKTKVKTNPVEYFI
jgi:hypothetical protein